MREVPLPAGWQATEAGTFAACLATILELPLDEVPAPGADEELPG